MSKHHHQKHHDCTCDHNHKHKLHDLEYERGELCLTHGHGEVTFELPFKPLWVWLYVKPHHHCGGVHQDEAYWHIHGNKVTVAADVKGEFAEVQWFVLGEK